MLWQYGVRHGDPRAGKISVLFAPVATVAWIWILTEWVDAPGLFAMAAMTAAGLIVSPHVFRAAKTRDGAGLCRTGLVSRLCGLSCGFR